MDGKLSLTSACFTYSGATGLIEDEDTDCLVALKTTGKRMKSGRQRRADTVASTKSDAKVVAINKDTVLKVAKDALVAADAKRTKGTSKVTATKTKLKVSKAKDKGVVLKKTSNVAAVGLNMMCDRNTFNEGNRQLENPQVIVPSVVILAAVSLLLAAISLFVFLRIKKRGQTLDDSSTDSKANSSDSGSLSLSEQQYKGAEGGSRLGLEPHGSTS